MGSICSSYLQIDELFVGKKQNNITGESRTLKITQQMYQWAHNLNIFFLIPQGTLISLDIVIFCCCCFTLKLFPKVTCKLTVNVSDSPNIKIASLYLQCFKLTTLTNIFTTSFIQHIYACIIYILFNWIIFKILHYIIFKCVQIN